MASISNAGDMITGVYESGWESLPKNRNGVILQFGMPQKSLDLLRIQQILLHLISA